MSMYFNTKVLIEEGGGGGHYFGTAILRGYPSHAKVRLRLLQCKESTFIS